MTYYELAALISMLFYVFCIAYLMMLIGFVDMLHRWLELGSNK